MKKEIDAAKVFRAIALILSSREELLRMQKLMDGMQDRTMEKLIESKEE